MLKSRGKSLCLAAFVAVLLTGCGQTDQDALHKENISKQQIEQLHLLNQSAQEVINHLQQGQILAAKLQVDSLYDQATRINYQHVTTTDGLAVFAQSIVQARGEFNRVKFSYTGGMVAAIRLRLAVDALNHDHQPMWMQYEQPMMKNLQRIEQAGQGKDLPRMKEALRLLQQDYSLIRPAVIISRGAESVVRADSLFVFLNRLFASGIPQSTDLATGVNGLHEEFQGLFHPDRATFLYLSDQPNPLIPSAILTTVILLVLAYVGWRKYKYTRGYVIVNRHDVE